MWCDNWWAYCYKYTNGLMMADWECMSVCVRRGITIYPLPKDNSRGVDRPDCYIYVNKNGKLIKSPHVYKQDKQLYTKIYELYRFYYDKITRC